VAADNDDLLLWLNYIDTLSPAEHVFRQHSNPLQEYNEMKFRHHFRLSKSTVFSLLLEVGIIHDRFDYSNYYYGTIDRQLPCVTLHNGQAHSGAPSTYSKQKQSSRRLVIGRGVCSEYSPRPSVPLPGLRHAHTMSRPFSIHN